MDFARVLAHIQKFPVALVDLDAFDRNTQAVASQVRGGQTIRVATKSIRVPALIRRVLDSGLPFKGLMTYSAFETLDLAKSGFDDFLLAYPVATTSEVEALAEVVQQKKTVRVIVDSIEHLDFLSRSLGDVSIEVVFDVDLSLRLLGGKIHLGVRRSPLRTSDQVWALYQKLLGFKNLRFGGIMGYEAQVAGLGDRNPFSKFLNLPKAWIRKISKSRAATTRAAIHKTFERNGVQIHLFNGGGSGSLNWTHDEVCLTEMAAGSAWFSPHLFDYYSNIRFEPSCFFALNAVRHSDPGFVTLQGGGYIASGEPGWDRVPLAHWPKGVHLVPTEGCGEVQTPVTSKLKMPLGKHVVFRHAKAGELMERFNEVVLVQDNQIKQRVPSYRGQGLCYF